MVIRRTSVPAVVVRLWKTILHADKHGRMCDVMQMRDGNVRLSSKVVTRAIRDSVREGLVVKFDEKEEYFRLPPDEV